MTTIITGIIIFIVLFIVCFGVGLKVFLDEIDTWFNERSIVQ